MSDPFDLEAVRARQRAAREALAQELDDTPELTVAERIAAIVECGLCDDDGYSGTVVCDHREHSTPEARQAAKDRLRQAIEQRRAQ